MSKHTPGPWSVLNCGPHWNNPSIENYRIKSGPAYTKPHGYDVAWSPDGELVAEHVYEQADARLIAAAPLLLEALIELSREEWRDEGDPILSQARGKARAAIAAATGET